MQKGTIDGAAIPLGVLEIFNLYEVAKYWTHVPTTTAYFTISMNKAKWNSLPPDIQKAIMSVCGYEGSRTYAHNFHDSYDRARAQRNGGLGKEGRPQNGGIYRAQGELDRWIQTGGKPVWDRWAENVEAKGLPAKDVLADVLKLIESEPQ